MKFVKADSEGLGFPFAMRAVKSHFSLFLMDFLSPPKLCCISQLNICIQIVIKEWNQVSDHKLEIPLLNLKFSVSYDADFGLHETKMSSLVNHTFFMSVLTLVSSQ